MLAIKVAHREAKTWSDWFALGMTRFFRWGMDVATFYRHDHSLDKAASKNNPTAATMRDWFAMNERKWLVRMVFLESVAGVPGMVAGMLRHLHSLRRMRRDNGW